MSLLCEAMEMFHQGIEAARNSDLPPNEQLRAVWQFFYDFYREQPEYHRVLMFLHNEGLRDTISPDVIKEINRRAGRNFRLVAEIVQAGVDARIYIAPISTREAWWTCCGRY